MTELIDMRNEVEPAAAAMISVQRVTHTYGVGGKAVHALGPVDVDIAEGEFTCLVGPSGCGKSTLLRAIAGLASPSDGQIELRVPASHKASVATVFQDYGIFPWKTVEGNVSFGLSALKLPGAEVRERTDVWLERLGLRDFRRAFPSQLSGGMRQRVAIARAMAAEPDVLLMDEPFAALDAQMREMLQEVLLEVSGNSGRTVVFVTHSLEEAIILGDRVLVMSSRPGSIIDDVHIPFPRPRDASVRQSGEFGAIRGKLWNHLRAEVEQQVASQRRGPTA